jgi:hypothetical protein
VIAAHDLESLGRRSDVVIEAEPAKGTVRRRCRTGETVAEFRREEERWSRTIDRWRM